MKRSTREHAKKIKLPESAQIKKGSLWTGTSNIVLQGTKKTFPEAFQSRSRLAYYASLFNSLEINSSFYKVPLPATFKKWCDEVPDNFKFTVKLWREITHAKKLAFNPANIHSFMQAANCVDDKKKGCLLIQFPASITIEYLSAVELMLQQINGQDVNQTWKKCIEFRHTSWYTGDAYAMLNHNKASLVLHDMPASRIAEVQTESNFVYVRFHGIKGDYRGTYDDTLLHDYAKKIETWLQQKKDVYVYFNNTIGNAFGNARHLAASLQTYSKVNK